MLRRARRRHGDVKLMSALAIALASSAMPAVAQDTERAAFVAYVDSATGLMEHYSVRRAEVDWPSLRSAARSIVDSASRPDTAAAYAAVRQALAKLGDHHSFLATPAEVRRLTAQDPTPSSPNAPPEIRILPGRVGYARIPPYDGLDSALIHGYAVAFQARLRSLAKRVRCGWVVDLRGNTGGNMWPMLAGIGPVLGDGLAGRFVRADTAEAWGYTHGYAWEGSDTIVHVPNPLDLSATSAHVAVLTDSMTASSGEAITISFRGRPGARSFGAPTAGLSTGNQEYALSDGSMLFLTTSIEADRIGHLYGSGVVPDTIVAPEDALSAAAAWLQSSGCRRR